MDGTLINSESVCHKIIKEICEKFGKVYPKQLAQKLYGATDQKISETVVETLKLPIKPTTFHQELINLSNKYMKKTPIQKGVERLLNHLHANKIPLALATNSTDQAVRLQMIAHPKIFALFHHMVTISDAEVYRGKPFPDVYCVAASRFPAKPKNRECLVFEDTPVGVEAAVAAGMQVVMVPDKRIIHTKNTSKATLVLPSLLHFRPELFGLPPFPESHPSHHKGLIGIKERKKVQMHQVSNSFSVTPKFYKNT